MLIPFAKSKITGKLVGVDDVKSGKACNCICPSCDAIMVARKGDIKAHHFAHEASNAKSNVKHICEYSFYVSVRAMLLQLFEGDIVVYLPKGMEIRAADRVALKLKSKTITVSKGASLLLQNIETNTNFRESRVDGIAKIASTTLILFITHAERPIPDILLSKAYANESILAIDINDIEQFFQAQNTPYHQALITFLKQENNPDIQWLQHHRYEKQISSLEHLDDSEKDNDSVRQSRKEENVVPHNMRRDNTDFTNKRKETFECVICEIKFEAINIGLVKCPNCKEHLFIKGKN